MIVHQMKQSPAWSISFFLFFFLPFYFYIHINFISISFLLIKLFFFLVVSLRQTPEKWRINILYAILIVKK